MRTSYEDESMDVDTPSQRLQGSIYLVTFNKGLSVYKENCLEQKCKMLLVTTVESYSLITFEILLKKLPTTKSVC